MPESLADHIERWTPMGILRGMARRSAVLLAALALAGVLAGPGATLAVEPSVSLDVSWTRAGSATVYGPGDALLVGDEVTVHPVVVGGGDTCILTFHRIPSVGYAELVAFPGGLPCADWTFILPPTPAGVHELSAYTGAGAAQTARLQLPVTAGGVARPFVSNMPLTTWDLDAIYGSDHVAFGDAWTIPATDLAG